MKKFFILVAVLFSTSFVAQEIGVDRKVVTMQKIDEKTQIFDKDSGKQIKYAEFISLRQAHPNSALLIKDEDIYGNPLSYYFTKNRFEEGVSKSENANVEIIRKDIYDRVFDLNNVKSKGTLVVLQLDLVLQYINLEHIKEAEDAAMSRGFTSVILTASDVGLSKDFAIAHELKSVIIPNAKNLMDKFKTNRFPMYYILNQNGVIISSLKYSYEVEDELEKLD